MDVLRLHGVGDLRLSSEQVPRPTPGEVLLRVSRVGICGSDLHWLEEAGIGDAHISNPLVLGHEFSAVVDSPGSALDGQRVAVDPAIPCQECEYCLDGNPNLCIRLRFAGHGRQDGALRQYMAWPERCLHPLPESISDEEGAMLEPLGVALHAADLGRIHPGDAVGVFGVGPIGLLVVQLARVAGAGQIIVTDRLAHRLEAAYSLGATRGFLVTDEWDQKEAWRATGERGVDVAFEAAGENQAVETAITAAKPGGQVILVGIPDQDWTAFRASTARRKGLTIKLARRMKFTYPRAIQLVADGSVDVRSLITHRFKLSEYEQAFQVARRREGIKVLIQP
jgi:L-iditol 2-dehydrogenase